MALAAALKADVCEIYTDVEGVYTTDPNICHDARKLKKVSYDEMLEMASLGAKVLQTRSVEFAKKYNVPVMVKSSFTDAEGTLVTKEDKDMEKVVVSGVTYNKDEAKITVAKVPDRPGIAAKLFEPLTKAHEKPCGRCLKDVREPVKGKCQYPDDLNLRDKDIRGDRRKIYGTGGKDIA